MTVEAAVKGFAQENARLQELLARGTQVGRREVLDALRIHLMKADELHRLAKYALARIDSRRRQGTDVDCIVAVGTALEFVLGQVDRADV